MLAEHVARIQEEEKLREPVFGFSGSNDVLWSLQLPADRLYRSIESSFDEWASPLTVGSSADTSFSDDSGPQPAVTNLRTAANKRIGDLR